MDNESEAVQTLPESLKQELQGLNRKTLSCDNIGLNFINLILFDYNFEGRRTITIYYHRRAYA